MLDHAVLTTFVFAAIAALVLLLAYFANKFVEGVVGNTSKLTTSVEKMTTLISNVEKEQVFLRTRLAQHSRDIAALQKTKRCTNENCPFATLHVHMRDGDVDLQREAVEDAPRLPFDPFDPTQPFGELGEGL